MRSNHLVFTSFQFEVLRWVFDQVWPKSKQWVSRTHSLTEPWIASNGKLMNTKFIPLIKVYILSNTHNFIWKRLDHSIFKSVRIHSKTLIFGTMDGLKWKTHEYQYCSTHQDLHFIYSPFLHLTKCSQSVVQNPHFPRIVSYSLCEIQDFVSIVYINFPKWTNGLYKKFGYWWALTTWNSKDFHSKSFSPVFDQSPSSNLKTCAWDSNNFIRMEIWSMYEM